MTERRVSYPFVLSVAILGICGAVFLALFAWEIVTYGWERGGFVVFVQCVAVWALVVVVRGGFNDAADR